jgi:serine/threonine protein kinase
MELDPQLIGKGGYGCAFAPPLPCRKSKLKLKKGKNNKTRYVGKIMKEDDAEIELNISTVIKGIPGYERYYIIQEEDNCDTKNFTKIKEKYSSTCPPISKLDNSEMIQLISKYGGKSLNNIVITSSFSLIKSLKHVLEGVSKLNKQGICHLDLKGDNMLVDFYGTIRIIDFGISFLGDETTEQTVKEHQFPFSPEYDAFPPELAVQEGLHNTMSLRFAIQQSIQNKKIMRTAATLLGLDETIQEQMLYKFWISDPVSLETHGKHWVKWFRTYWRSWDAWAIGVVFLKLLQKSLLVPLFIQNEWKEYKSKIILVLKGLLQADPRVRLTAEEALSLLQN